MQQAGHLLVIGRQGGGLLQVGLGLLMSIKGDFKPLPFIEDAASQGVQVLCFQEVFTQPYFCPSQDRKWYAAAERIPDGPTVRLMQEYAKQYDMVVVVPMGPETVTFEAMRSMPEKVPLKKTSEPLTTG